MGVITNSFEKTGVIIFFKKKRVFDSVKGCETKKRVFMKNKTKKYGCLKKKTCVITFAKI